MVRDTITNPTDKIGLPDRVATQMRGLQPLSRFDDNEAPLGLGDDQEKIHKQRIKELEIHNLAESGTLTVSKAKAQEKASSSSGGLPSQPPPKPHQPPASQPQGGGTGIVNQTQCPLRRWNHISRTATTPAATRNTAPNSFSQQLLSAEPG
jgi:hypothetical protein